MCRDKIRFTQKFAADVKHVLSSQLGRYVIVICMYQMNMVPKGFLYTSVLSMYWEGKNVQIHLTINSCNVVTRHSFFIEIKITITWAEWAII